MFLVTQAYASTCLSFNFNFGAIFLYSFVNIVVFRSGLGVVDELVAGVADLVGVYFGAFVPPARDGSLCGTKGGIIGVSEEITVF